MLKLRSFAAPGPIKHRCLRETTLQHYNPRDWTMPPGQTGLKPFFMSRQQVPGLATHFMRYVKQESLEIEPNPWVGRWIRNWSRALVDTLVRAASKDDERVGPLDYPYSAAIHFAALRAYPLSQKHLMVAGSVSPWLEAIALSRGAASVSTVDWLLPESESPRIIVRSMGEMRRERARPFDAILSFSSVEHDGLGRYGDPINPFGDVAAMGEFAMLLKPRGLLFLGLPVGTEGRTSEGCRFYDRTRFFKLSEGWQLLATFAPPSRWRCCPFPPPTSLAPNESAPVLWPGESFWDAKPFGRDDWHYQPLFVLEKTMRAAGAAFRRTVAAG